MGKGEKGAGRGQEGECALSNQSCRQQINLMSDTRHKTCRLVVEPGIVEIKMKVEKGEIACERKGVPWFGFLAIATQL